MLVSAYFNFFIIITRIAPCFFDEFLPITRPENVRKSICFLEYVRNLISNLNER